VTFGPALVGLLGGGLTLGLAWATVSTLLKNVAATYAQYPSLTPPWLARDFSVPDALVLPLTLLGFAGLLAMGLATAWCVRSKDVWGDASAGMTTALTGTLTAYAAGIGWAVTLALVVVPSIADFTLFGEATRTSDLVTGHPTDVLVASYPDLVALPPDERGRAFFAKMVSDQVVGSAAGAWLGVVLALATVGVLGFCGTLAGGWLLRRGGSWLSIVLPYGELTVSTALAAGRLGSAALGMGSVSGWGAVWLVAATALVVAGVVRRWHWLVRVNLALVWILAFHRAGLDGGEFGAMALAAYLAYAALGFLLVRQGFSRGRQAAAGMTT
jgi:hypothetical protein